MNVLDTQQICSVDQPGLLIESNLSRTATNGMQGGGFAVAKSACFSTARTDLVRMRFELMPQLNDMNTWTKWLGHSHLRSFTDKDGHFGLEQNADKNSKWAKLASQGHDIAWEFERSAGAYTGRMLIDGEIYTLPEATKKFLKK